MVPGTHQVAYNMLLRTCLTEKVVRRIQQTPLLRIILGLLDTNSSFRKVSHGL